MRAGPSMAMGARERMEDRESVIALGLRLLLPPFDGEQLLL